jgi:uncharacterized protein (DUF1800 family)
MATTYLNCAVGSLDVYSPSAEIPWNEERVKHLYRRIGFGASREMIENALVQNPAALIDQLIDEALVKPNFPRPDWADWAISDYDPDDILAQILQQHYEIITYWGSEFHNDNAIRAKLMLFWSNHFVTKIENYNCASYNYDYFRMLESYSLGNFRDFAHEIGTSPAMLLFLNGVQNTRFQPNENYARELLELFTLGRDNNYTQGDIEEAARALTGWNGFTENCAPITFVPQFHDPGQKTIFGRTGAWNYDDLIELIFTERATECSNYVCSLIYNHYVNREPNEDIIAGMAQVFLDNNFEIAPVLRVLFKSEHFFDEAHFGGVIKSHIESVYGFIKESEYPINEADIPGAFPNRPHLSIHFANSDLGQALFNPPDVAGWPGDRDWINSSSLTNRWNVSDFFIFDFFQNHRNALILWVQSLVGNTNDPYVITKRVIDFLISKELQSEQDYENGVMAFKWEVPENYFEDGSWNLDWDQEIVGAQIAFLMRYISRLPEFQLA